MGEYKGTKNYLESDDIEVAYFQPSYHEEGDEIICQSIAIAPLTNNDISFIFSKTRKINSSFIRFVFTEKEVDMLIAALKEAKKRWKTGKVIE
jgi:hypothetical protein